MVKTDRQRLVEALMKSKRMGDLGEFVAARRAEGVSWAEISYEIREAVDVNVSYEALRRWFPEVDRNAGPAD